jgi:hypothetical protein
MKQAGYSKRPRGRSPERYKQTTRQTAGGDGEEPKFRGNPQQFVEKYLTLARDATSSGDPIAAENYLQYADHFYRIALASRLSRSVERRVEPKDKEISVNDPVVPTAEPLVAATTKAPEQSSEII